MAVVQILAEAASADNQEILGFDSEFEDLIGDQGK